MSDRDIKNIEEKSIFSKNTDFKDINEINNYKWKKVIGKHGGKLGRVWDIVIKDNKLVAIMTRKGFKKYFIGTEFIASMTKFTIKLSIEPVLVNLGKKVFDNDGKYLGKVIHIIKPSQKNDFTELIVRKHILSKKKIIKKSDIDINEKNIILNKSFD